jgi:hypothetical protein
MQEVFGSFCAIWMWSAVMMRSAVTALLFYPGLLVTAHISLCELEITLFNVSPQHRQNTLVEVRQVEYQPLLLPVGG